MSQYAGHGHSPSASSRQGGVGGLPQQNAAEVRLHRTVESLATQQHELNELMRLRAATPMNQRETEIKDQQIRALQMRLAQTQTEMQSLNTLVRKQEATIKAQSDEIQKPKNSNFVPTPQYPFRGGHPPGNDPMRNPHPQTFNNNPGINHPRPDGDLRSVYDQPPANPSFSSFGAPGTPGYQQQFGHNNPLPFHSQPRPVRVNEWGSPEPLRAHPWQGPQYEHLPPSGNRIFSPDSGRSQQQTTPFIGPQLPLAPGTLMAPGQPSANVDNHPIRADFQKIFQMCQKYALAHLNQPSTSGDSLLPATIKQMLTQAATVTTAFPLMNSPHTRHILAGKIVVQWVVRNILKVDTFAGFAPDIDQEINSNRAAIYQTTPPQLRCLYLNTITNALNKMKTRPGFYKFVEQLARNRGNELWAIIMPLMHHKTSRDWEDLLQLMIETHQLAEKMYTGAEEYRFESMDIGSRFNKTIMISQTAQLSHFSPEQLEGQGAIVTLCITPHATVRSSTSTGLVSTVTLLPALVLVKLPNRNF